MLVLRHLESIGRRFQRPLLTLGNFDGVHVGHQEIFRRLVERARDVRGTSIALTFHPHPAQILSPARAPLLLTDWRARIERIAAGGVDVIIVQRFTEAFSQIGADGFVRRLLVDGLGVEAIVVGHRVRFGHDRRGDANLLDTLGKQLGIDVEIVGPVEVNGAAVSSSAARRALSDGDLQQARALLGRRPSVTGRVVHGHHRGRSLGFPTANLRIRQLVLPPDGVYAVRVRRRDVWRDGVANLGFNPTFHENERSLEPHLFDFDDGLYGERLEVEFVERLRGEVKFPNVGALVEQIKRDVDAARLALA
ncbi:MAG TPA: bifunctional riboflavin kinase/FAD synthetase, partial [Candidatus Acidoferrales bacterium]|nr:bifunctional riboflavin kinase/FAD synthetase [Candidatus Acidoferrales bacterium]